MILKNDIYIANEDLVGFYSSIISKDSVLYLYNKIDNGIRHRNTLHYRFVFDTIKGASANDSPKGNKRISCWFNRGKFDQNIKPYILSNKIY